MLTAVQTTYAMAMGHHITSNQDAHPTTHCGSRHQYALAQDTDRRCEQQALADEDELSLALPSRLRRVTAITVMRHVLLTVPRVRAMKELLMRSRPRLITGVLLAGNLLGCVAPHAAAQEASPDVPVPTNWSIPGIEVIASVPDPSLAPGMVLEFDRITWAPGFEVPMHFHPAIDILYVISGSVAWSVEDGTAQVYRAAIAGTPVPVELLEPGSEAVLTPGDVIIFDYPKTGMRHSARVVGDEPVIMMDPVLYDPSQELTVFPEGVTPVSEG